jgi:hypothetical protein
MLTTWLDSYAAKLADSLAQQSNLAPYFLKETLI